MNSVIVSGLKVSNEKKTNNLFKNRKWHKYENQSAKYWLEGF